MPFTSLFLAGGLALVQSIGPSAPASAPLRLADLYHDLRDASPRIAGAGALVDAARARVAPARRPPDPRVQFGLMNRELSGLGYNTPLGMDQVQLTQMVPIGGKLGLAGQAASARASAEEARADETGWAVRAQAATAFYDLYRIDGSIAVARRTAALLEELTRIAETMYGVGTGRQADVLRAQVEVARADEEVIGLEAERAAARAQLNALLARDPDADPGTPVLPRFPDSLPALADLLREATSGRPMVRASEAEVRAAEATARGAHREIWPDLEVGVQYGQQPMPGGGTDRMGSLMLGASLPVFAGSRQFALRREADAMQAMARAELAETRAATRGRVGELYARIEGSERLGRLYRTTILPQADAAVESARASYRVGGIDFMTLLDDQLTADRYRQELFALDAARGAALAELEMLLGRALFDPAATAVEGS